MDTKLNSNNLTSNQVAKWLDLHPEFLNDYLRNLKMKRRCSSIILNETSITTTTTTTTTTSSLLNNNENSSINEANNNNNNNGDNNNLLSNLHSNLRINATSAGSLSIQNTNSNIFTSIPENDAQLVELPSHIMSTAANNESIFKSSLKNLSNNIKSNSIKYINNYTQLLSGTNLFNNTTTNNNNSNRSDQINSNKYSISSRNNFKHLSLYEKIFKLVRTVYESLDLKQTCEKILNTVSLLLDADRCSLFLVVDDDEDETNFISNESISLDDINDNNNNTKKKAKIIKKCLVSVVFDAKSNEKLRNDDKNIFSQDNVCNSDNNSINNEIKLPYGMGIAGIVAATGISLNISDAYKDPRFNPNIDRKTGYKTKSILCLPILNENGKCIAVAEAINKLNDDSFDSDNYKSFTLDDEEVCLFYNFRYFFESQHINLDEFLN
jgi:transcriptional regulator with GAF, ATPase, and Fis domain